ncbi:MAG TPA: hypothetical protein PLC48_08400, partial [Ferruginibacter sp.]|nr:hypothetical protein [Ferruginibacter sp.]
MNVKNYLLYFCCCIMVFSFAAQPGHAQSPGGISTGNTIWIRSDNGITNTSGTVTQWQDNSGATITGPLTVQPIQAGATLQTAPQFIPIGINFNPYVRFNGLDNSLSSTNTFTGTSLVGNSNVSVFQVVNVKGGIVWLKWETDQVGSGARLGFENAGGNIRFDFPKAVPATAGQNVGISNVQNKHSLSTVYADATASVNRLNGADENTLPIPGPGDFGSASDKLVIGNESLLNLPAEVDMAELIIYSNTLPAADINKIESYLAIKYGFTLNQSAPWSNNYTATNGTVIWNNAQNNVYGNDITGIGRNDATALLQKQSLSVNTSAIVTLYNGTYAAGPFPADNQSNSNGFTNDLSWLIMGDNGGTTTLNQCIFNGKGQRMQRVWIVSKTGTVGAVTLSVDQAAVPANTKNLLVSANPAFPPGATTLIPLTAANGKLFAPVTFNHNEYYSFSSDTLIVNTVVTHPLCTNPNSGSVATTVSGGNTPFTYS